MAKSNYLSRLLFAAIVCICVYVAGDYLAETQRANDKFQNKSLVLTQAGSELSLASNAVVARKERFRVIYSGERREIVKQMYSAETGVREATGKNDGSRVEEYLRYVGLPKGNPWCAAFVCWVYGNSGVPNPRSGWSPSLFPASKVIWERKRQLRWNSATERLPRPADVFGIWFADKKRIAHAGFVDSWGKKYVVTVEGNTNESGSREGDGVYRKRRLISSVYQVASWIPQGQGPHGTT